MIEWLESVDRTIVLTVNRLHTPWLDEVMWAISGKFTWIPLYLLLIFLAYRSLGLRKTLWLIGLTILSIGLSDFIASQLIKNWVERYRPSHHALLTNKLHFYAMKPGEFYKGGQYGFVSSHAANFVALTVLLGLTLKPYYKWIYPLLILITLLVCLSRIYLGVHYLSDIIGGALIGGCIAFFGWKNVWKSKINP